MTTKPSDEIAEMYAQLDAAAGNKGTTNPVNKFIKNAKAQIAKVDVLLSDLSTVDTKLVPQSDWFFRSGGGWVVKFGRSKFKTLNGTEWFEAKDLEDVKRIIGIGIKLAQADSSFQNQIKDAARKNPPEIAGRPGDAPKRGRRAKKA